MSKFEIYTFEIFVYSKHVVALFHQFLCWIFVFEVGCAFSRSGSVGQVEIVVTFCHVSVDNTIDIQFFFCYIFIEIRVLFVAHLLDDTSHRTFINIDFAVFESSFDEFLGKETILLLGFLEGESDFCFCLRGLYDIQPFLSWLLIALGENLNLVAGMELLSEAYGPSVDFTSHAVVANTRVDIVGEIKHSGTFREVEQITLRGKYIHLIFLQICGELVHQLQIVIILQCTSDIGKPFVNAAFSLSDTFIAPVGSQTMLGDIIHTFCSDLDFHPFLFRTQYGGVQTFISITLRYG